MIHRFKLRLSNAYLIVGTRPVLVDTGAPGDFETIKLNLKKLGFDLSDLSLILHTHVHADHFGSTAEILAEIDCPMGYHAADQPFIDRGDNGLLNGIGLRGKMMCRVFSYVPFSPIQATIQVKDEMKLDEFGVDAVVRSTPGHTAGSISVILANGDAIIGDIMMGGYLGGLVFPSRPNHHYFLDDAGQARESVDRLLSCTSGKLHVGHGRAARTPRRIFLVSSTVHIGRECTTRLRPRLSPQTSRRNKLFDHGVAIKRQVPIVDFERQEIHCCEIKSASMVSPSIGRRPKRIPTASQGTISCL